VIRTASGCWAERNLSSFQAILEPGKSGYMKTLTATLLIVGQLTTIGMAQSAAQWDVKMQNLEKQSKRDQEAEDKAEAKRVAESNKVTSDDAEAKQKGINSEAGQYSETMRWADFIERATNAVPSPERFSEIYLKDLGEFKVTCETNRRSGTINYCVSGCQPTNTAAVFSMLKKVPNRLRLSQGTNSVTVAIKLPTVR
jgi:hypothetical protein